MWRICGIDGCDLLDLDIGWMVKFYLIRYITGFRMDGSEAKLYSTDRTDLKTEALKYDLHLLDAKVRHLGTDRNVKILSHIYDYIKEDIDMRFNLTVKNIYKVGDLFTVETDGDTYTCENLILATGRSGSRWLAEICRSMDINFKSNRVDIGVRVELPADVFRHIIDDVYESKIVYRTEKYNDMLYGVEVKFYNSKIEVDGNLETAVKGLYVLGDDSGVTHSLSQASASGIHVARVLMGK